MTEVRGGLLTCIPTLYTQFKDKLPYSDNPEKDEELYVQGGRFFLLTLSPEALYYGRYVSEMTDVYIDEGFRVKKSKDKTPAKAPKRRKLDI